MMASRGGRHSRKWRGVLPPSGASRVALEGLREIESRFFEQPETTALEQRCSVRLCTLSSLLGLRLPTDSCCKVNVPLYKYLCDSSCVRCSIHKNCSNVGPPEPPGLPPPEAAQPIADSWLAPVSRICINRSLRKLAWPVEPLCMHAGRYWARTLENARQGHCA